MERDSKVNNGFRPNNRVGGGDQTLVGMLP